MLARVTLALAVLAAAAPSYADGGGSGRAAVASAASSDSGGAAGGGPAEAAGGPEDIHPPGSDAAPNRRYVVEEIRLEGLARTRPETVRRYVTVLPGDPLDDRAVLVSRLRLLQTGWFSRVETRVERGRERGQVVLVFDFTERSTLVVTDLVLGSTSPQPLYGGVGISEGNFLGRGVGLSGGFVYGGTPVDQPLAPARFSLRGGYYQPDLELGDLPLVLGASALYVRGEEFACPDPDCAAYEGRFDRAPRLRYERVGAELTFGVRPAPFERMLVGFRLERISSERTAAVGGPDGPAPSLLPGDSLLTALTATYDRDTRNDPFLATAGTRVTGSVTVGTQVIGGDYEYGRYMLQLEGDRGLPWGHALKLLGAAGAVQGEAPFFERFYAADFAYFSLGPALGRALELNFSTDSRYDAYLAMAGAEYAIPLWEGSGFFRRGYLALGARWLWTASGPRAGRTTASSIPFSGEAALRLDTPIGSFNLSAGYALDNFL